MNVLETLAPMTAGRAVRFLLVPVLAVGLLATACGSVEDDSSGTTTDSGETTSSDDGTTPTDSTTSTSTTSAPGTTTEVQVFFSGADPDECGAVTGFDRTAPAGVDPIRFAFDELVEGPTTSELSSGAISFFSAPTAGTVRSVKTDGDRLVVDFDDFRDTLGRAGATTSCGSAALVGQLNATAFQFDEIDTVRYELKGSCDRFGEWLQSACLEVERDDWEAAVAGLLPGEPFEGVLPPGAVLGVVGVAADDELNVRARPGAQENVVDTLTPLTTGLVFSGRERLIGDPPSIWYEIDTGSVTGWVNSRYVAPLAGTVDITSEVVAAVGKLPTGETVVQVAEIVIRARTDLVEGDIDVVLVDGPALGDLNEVVYDILGFYDDSGRGERLHLFVTPPEVADGPMTLKSVELTDICHRGDGMTERCP